MLWKANCYLQRPVPRDGDHMFGQPFLLMKVVLGRWTGPVGLELQYAFPNFPTVPCNQIKPLLISRLRTQCSGRQCSQSCSRWRRLRRSQIAQPMFTVVYRPAAPQTVCRVGRRTLGHGSVGCMLNCIAALRSDAVHISVLFLYLGFLEVKRVESYRMLAYAILLSGLVTKIDRYNI